MKCIKVDSFFKRVARKHFLTLIAGLLGIIILLEGITLFHTKNNGEKHELAILGKMSVVEVNGKEGLQKVRKQIAEAIESAGPEQAYNKFKDLYASTSFGTQHTVAHVFGELLYETIGIEGVGVCDNSFAFGCYHGFFGAAVEKEGLDVAPDLDKACIKKWGLKGLGCPHGIGHGVLSYTGETKILDALEICSMLSWKEPIGGCTSGVFMEYNFRTMQDPNKISIRPLDQEDVHAPCSNLPQKYLQACYYEQANWWEKVFDYDYKLIGKLCQGLQNKLNSEACFRGLGQTIGPSSKYDIQEAKNRCGFMPDVETELLCRQGVAWSFFAEPSQTDNSAQLCDDLDEKRKYICVTGTGYL